MWFELEIDRDGEQVRVSGRGSRGERLPSRRMRTDAALEALSAMTRKVAWAAANGLPLDDATLTLARALHEDLFRGELRDVMARLREAAGDGRVLVRLFTGDRTLQAVPWEALCEPGTTEGFLGTDPRLCVARGAASSEPWQPREIAGKVRVLALAPGSAEGGLRALTAALEPSIEAGAVEWLEPIAGEAVTPRSLFRHLRSGASPHILHFLGHGGLDAQGRPVLRLADEDEEETWLTAESLARELGASFKGDLRLIVLEACQGASPGALGPAAEILTRAGADAVVAFLWPVKAAVARTCSTELYRTLTGAGQRRGDIGAALAAARRTLLADSAEAFSPVLYLRGSSAVLFSFREARSPVPPAPQKSLPPVFSPAPLSLVPSSTSEQPGGVVSHRSPCYVTRPRVEEACLEEIGKTGALIRIKGPRQMGKTSLMIRVLEHAAGAGARSVPMDLRMADGEILSDLNRLLRWLCAVVSRRLKIPPARIEETWDDLFGAKDNCTAYFEEHLLPGQPPLVLAVDNVDRVFDSPRVAEEVLSLFRAWHEMSKSQDPWCNLRLVLVYSTEMYLPMNINRSPFNVGLPANLTEWTAPLVEDLAKRHGLALGGAELDALVGLVGGHPHLIRTALHHIQRGMSLEDVLSTAATDQGIFADHLKHLLWQVQGQAELASALAKVLAAEGPVRLRTDLSFKLVSMGLVTLRGDDVLPARELYRRYLGAHLPVSA
jgi:AAA-like domain/CHAT domain